MASYVAQKQILAWIAGYCAPLTLRDANAQQVCNLALSLHALLEVIPTAPGLTNELEAAADTAQDAVNGIGHETRALRAAAPSPAESAGLPPLAAAKLQAWAAALGAARRDVAQALLRGRSDADRAALSRRLAAAFGSATPTAFSATSVTPPVASHLVALALGNGAGGGAAGAAAAAAGAGAPAAAAPAPAPGSGPLAGVPSIAWADIQWPDGVPPSPADPRRHLIARGGFGAVYRASLLGMGPVAVKVLDMEGRIPPKRLRELGTECRNQLRASAHPNVASFLGIATDAASGRIGIVSRFAAGGSLYDGMMEDPDDAWASLAPLSKLKSLAGAVAAVSHMHSIGIVHGDVKPQNVLVAAPVRTSAAAGTEPECWVCDFGLAKTAATVRASAVRSQLAAGLDSPAGGTVGYMAPETVSRGVSTTASDVFSLGLMIWASLAGDDPFPGVSDSSSYHTLVVTGGTRPDLSELPAGCPAGLGPLLQRCWAAEPGSRPTSAELLDALTALLYAEAPAPAPAPVRRQPAADDADADMGDRLRALLDQATGTEEERLASVPEVVRLLSEGGESVADAAAAVATASMSDCEASRAAFCRGGAVPPLLGLLGNEDSSAAGQAAEALGVMVKGSDARRRMLIDAGALPPIVALLSRRDASAAENAATSLCLFAGGDDALSHAVAEAGALPPLVAMLRSDNEKDPPAACAAIRNIAAGLNEDRDTTLRAGALPALLALLPSDHPKTAEGAAAALSAIASGSKAHERALIDAGAVGPLTALLRSPHAVAVRPAARALLNVASSCDAHKDALIAVGAVTTLAKLLSRPGEGVAATAAKALAVVAAGSHRHEQAVVDAGAMPHLVRLLSSDDEDARVHAAAALYYTMAGAEARRDAGHAAGAIGPLVALLSSANPRLHQPAAGALSVMAAGEWARKEAIASAGAIVRLVPLLASEHGDTAEHACSCLSNLAAGHSATALLVRNSGALPHFVSMLSSTRGDCAGYAATALSNLAAIDEPSECFVAAAGAIPPLVAALGSTNEGLARRAAAAIRNLAGGEATSQAVAEADAMPELLRLARRDGTEASQNAVSALTNLLIGSTPRMELFVASGGPIAARSLLGRPDGIVAERAARLFRCLASGPEAMERAAFASGAVGPLVQMLASDKGDEAGFAAGALFNMTHGSSEAKATVADAGAVPHLLQLLAAGSDLAKAPAERLLKGMARQSRLADLIRRHASAGAQQALGLR